MTPHMMSPVHKHNPLEGIMPVVLNVKPKTQTRPGCALTAVRSQPSNHPNGYLMVNGHISMQCPRTTDSSPSEISYMI
jgi:hypothetical protein